MNGCNGLPVTYFDDNGDLNESINAHVRYDYNVTVDAMGAVRLLEILPLALASDDIYSDSAEWAQALLTRIRSEIGVCVDCGDATDPCAFGDLANGEEHTEHGRHCWWVVHHDDGRDQIT